jgi:pimeloyl-ACP methyl ester carboxylesterase
VSGPCAILLHGFPEFWYAWRKQIPALAASGYYVVALDQRGYNASSKPERVRDYALRELRGDIVAVADALGRERVLLAGHDWGGIVAWEVAMHHPDRVEKLAILNAPHPAVARRYLTSSVRQMMQSWYVLFFQLPVAPERLFSAREFALGVRSLVGTSAPGTFSDEDLEQYRRAWSEPGAVRSMIQWYRALARHSRQLDLSGATVQPPVRILWGSRDAFLLRELATESLAYWRSGDVVHFEDATHWLHHEQPDRVNEALLEWFGSR